MKLIKYLWFGTQKHLSQLMRRFIIAVFYRCKWEEPMAVYHIGLLAVDCIFQKVFRINAEADCPVNFTSRIMSFKRMTLGKNSRRCFFTAGGCYIQGMNGIKIGDNFFFASGVKIISANHQTGNLDEHVFAEPIRIGSDCWLGANAVILPGVQLGDRVIVGAGSVVTKSFPDGAVIAGVPARILKAGNSFE